MAPDWTDEEDHLKRELAEVVAQQKAHKAAWDAAFPGVDVIHRQDDDWWWQEAGRLLDVARELRRQLNKIGLARVRAEPRQQVRPYYEARFPDLLGPTDEVSGCTKGTPAFEGKEFTKLGYIVHRSCQRGRFHHLAYVIDGEVVAGLTIHAGSKRKGKRRRGKIDRVYTEPKFRRKGLAAALLRYARTCGVFSEVVHSDDLTEVGRKWKAAVNPPPEPLTYYGYHGSYRSFPTSTPRAFGGLHVGTRQAALDRVFHTRNSEGMGRGPKPAFIYPVVVRLESPLGSIEESLDETAVSCIVNVKEELTRVKASYDGLVYRNVVEDPGSISVLVFNLKSTEAGVPETLPWPGYW